MNHARNWTFIGLFYAAALAALAWFTFYPAEPVPGPAGPTVPPLVLLSWLGGTLGFALVALAFLVFWYGFSNRDMNRVTGGRFPTTLWTILLFIPLVQFVGFYTMSRHIDEAQKVTGTHGMHPVVLFILLWLLLPAGLVFAQIQMQRIDFSNAAPVPGEPAPFGAPSIAPSVSPWSTGAASAGSQYPAPQDTPTRWIIAEEPEWQDLDMDLAVGDDGDRVRQFVEDDERDDARENMGADVWDDAAADVRENVGADEALFFGHGSLQGDATSVTRRVHAELVPMPASALAALFFCIASLPLALLGPAGTAAGLAGLYSRERFLELEDRRPGHRGRRAVSWLHWMALSGIAVSLGVSAWMLFVLVAAT